MSFIKEIEEAQRVYKDILNGYSLIQYKDDDVYVKHLNDIDHGWIQEYKNSIYSEAQDKGVLSEKDKIETFIEQDIWDEKKEKRIEELTDELDNLKNTQSKLVLESQKKRILKPIEEAETELEEIEAERIEVLGITCENYAVKKVSEKYLQYTVYKDKNFTEHFLSEEEFDEIEDEALSALVMLNNIKLSNFNQDYIKKISICPFFLNSLMICKNNPMVFYGEPVCKLSNYQIELFSSGLRYKSVLEQKGKTPPSCKTLKEVVNWYEGLLDSTKIKSKEDAAGQTIFGASKEELMNITDNPNDDRNVVDLEKQAAKMVDKEGGNKGILTMDQMLKLHGEI